jgi:ketosteroid isomerase-like protein
MTQVTDPGTGPRPTPGSPTIGRPDVVAAVRAAFDRYEQALREADVATLIELFWDDPRCVRYGVADRQHGAGQIAAWRREHPGVPPGRTLCDTVIVAVDDRTAVVSTLFGYPGHRAEGRQTQTWARFAEGWRIIAAHVSEVPMA